MVNQPNTPQPDKASDSDLINLQRQAEYLLKKAKVINIIDLKNGRCTVEFDKNEKPVAPSNLAEEVVQRIAEHAVNAVKDELSENIAKSISDVVEVVKNEIDNITFISKRHKSKS